MPTPKLYRYRVLFDFATHQAPSVTERATRTVSGLNLLDAEARLRRQLFNEGKRLKGLVHTVHLAKNQCAREVDPEAEYHDMQRGTLRDINSEVDRLMRRLRRMEATA